MLLVASRRDSINGDSIQLDTKDGGVAAYPANKVTRIRHGIQRGDGLWLDKRYSAATATAPYPAYLFAAS
jgi:hypothetical protein